MHRNWILHPLGSEPSEKGMPRIEIDESEIIVNQNNKNRMFGLIAPIDKEARVFCVLNNRTKENLLPIIERNVLTNNTDNNFDIKARIILIVMHLINPEISKKWGIYYIGLIIVHG